MVLSPCLRSVSLCVRTLPVVMMLVLVTMAGCGPKASRHVSSHLDAGVLPDTLRVATLYSPTSYFLYREEPMGYDYALARRFTEDNGMVMDLTVAPSLASMIQLLDSGVVDLIAYEVPVTGEYRDKVLPCGPTSETHQVLVQPRRAGEPLIADVTGLVGKDVYVEGESKYYYRMHNLNDELGGGINIHAIDRDTLITEDLIEMVSNGLIPLTVVDSDIARINRTYYPNLDISLALSFPQRSTWAVSNRHQWLADSIDAWLSQEEPRDAQARLMKRYFERSKNESPALSIDLTKGRISPYDPIFRKYAASIDYDWRLMASQGFVESHFDTTKVSWAGARGLMQIMPSTARAYGSSAEAIVSPDNGVHTASRIIADLDKSLTRYVSDPDERIKFVLGAYNSGIAHVYDAIALARKLGYNPEVWDGNVAECLLLKSQPEYYNDPVCRFGYFRGRQTVAYVNEVMSFYTRCKQYIKA